LSGGEIVEALVQTYLIDSTPTQLTRAHSVELRGLVQRDEWVRAVPVAAWLGKPVDDHHVLVGLADDHVGERHADRTASDNQIVGGKFGPVGSLGHGGLHRSGGRSWSYGVTVHNLLTPRPLASTPHRTEPTSAVIGDAVRAARNPDLTA
jgi:hypothetical protein